MNAAATYVAPMSNFPDADEAPAKGDRFVVSRVGEVALLDTGYLPVGKYEVVSVSGTIVTFVVIE